MTKKTSGEKNSITVGALTACAIEIAQKAVVRMHEDHPPEWWKIEWRKDGRVTTYDYTYKPGFCAPQKVVVVFPESRWWEGYVVFNGYSAEFGYDIVNPPMLKPFERMCTS
jgi:hypothetical protein